MESATKLVTDTGELQEEIVCIRREAAHHAEQVCAVIDTGALRDEGLIYFDARLSVNCPTVEVPVADVCLRAALIRGLVETAARAWQNGRPPARRGTSLR